MPVNISLYIPIDLPVNDPNYVAPSIENDAQQIVEFVNDPTRNTSTQEDPGRKFVAGVSKYFKEKQGWTVILAWSHGLSSDPNSRRYRNSENGMQDMSATRYVDDVSPLMAAMCLRKEALKHAILRTVGTPKEGKFTVIELEMHHARFTSQSSGGSGGEDRLTENITMSFKKVIWKYATINAETGDIISLTKASFDCTSKTGSRDSLYRTAKSLLDSAREAVVGNKNNLTAQDLQTIQDLQLVDAAELDVDAVPAKGIEFVATTDEKLKKFRKVVVKKLTVEAIKEAVAAKFNKTPADIKALYTIGAGDRLIEIESDEQVSADFDEGEHVFVETN